MKINGNEIKVGNVILFNGRLCEALKTQHTQPGKGGAYLQVEMKDIKDGTKFNERFRSSETVEKIRLEQTEYQYLYLDGDKLALMDNKTYEQIEVSKEKVLNFELLKENENVVVETYEEDIISVTLPQHVSFVIEECEPVVKGQTVSSSYKPATLTNGVRIMVPQFIEQGDEIVIDTRDLTYSERVKK